MSNFAYHLWFIKVLLKLNYGVKPNAGWKSSFLAITKVPLAFTRRRALSLYTFLFVALCKHFTQKSNRVEHVGFHNSLHLVRARSWRMHTLHIKRFEEDILWDPSAKIASLCWCILANVGSQGAISLCT